MFKKIRDRYVNPFTGTLFFLLVSTITILPVAANAEDNEEDKFGFVFDSLKPPASPAFVILDITPTLVNRPQTPEAFAVGLITSIQEEWIPKDYAIEFAPYWMIKRELEYTGFYENGFLMRMYQNLSISLATTTLTTEISTGEEPMVGTTISFGVRTLIWDGKPKKKIREGWDYNRNKYQPNIKRLNGDLNDMREAADINDWSLRDSENYRPTPPHSESSEEDIETKNGQWKSEIEVRENYNKAIVERDNLYKDASKKTKDIEEINQQPVGFRLEVAFAGVVDFPEDRWDTKDFRRFGLWVTPAYHLDGQPFDFVGVVRYIYDKSTSTVQKSYGEANNTIDFWGRVVFDIRRFAASAECLGRYDDSRVEDKWKYKAVGVIEYQMTETISINSSFGKNYDPGDEDGSDLIANIGLNLGFGANPFIKFGEN